jgi:hypothetical protein
MVDHLFHNCWLSIMAGREIKLASREDGGHLKGGNQPAGGHRLIAVDTIC